MGGAGRLPLAALAPPSHPPSDLLLPFQPCSQPAHELPHTTWSNHPTDRPGRFPVTKSVRDIMSSFSHPRACPSASARCTCLLPYDCAGFYCMRPIHENLFLPTSRPFRVTSYRVHAHDKHRRAIAAAPLLMHISHALKLTRIIRVYSMIRKVRATAASSFDTPGPVVHQQPGVQRQGGSVQLAAITDTAGWASRSLPSRAAYILHEGT